MVSTIKNNKALGAFCVEKIVDEGVGVTVDCSLASADYVAVKVDDYYNSLRRADTPKMVDFSVIVDCISNNYVLYLMEMKGMEYSNVEVEEKFKNAIDIYLEKDFRDIFCADCYKYKDVRLFLISKKPQAALSKKSYKEYVDIYNKINAKDTLVKDIYMSERIYKFRNKLLRIEKEIPNGLVSSRKKD